MCVNSGLCLVLSLRQPVCVWGKVIFVCVCELLVCEEEVRFVCVWVYVMCESFEMKTETVPSLIGRITRFPVSCIEPGSRSHV